MYYVYRHLRLDSNTPFYVGKGQNQRAFDTYYRNQLHKRIVKKHGHKIEIIKYFKNENDAFRFERKLIKLYKSLGYCEANFTDGGEGLSGFSHSNISKNKIKNALSGRTHSVLRKENISKSHKNYFKNKEYRLKYAKAHGATEFYVYKNGKLIGSWINQAECCRDLNLLKSKVCQCLKGTRKSHKGYIFRRKK